MRTAWTMSELVTEVHALFCQTSHRRCDSLPPLLRMWCTCFASAATAPFAPVDSWWSVCPVLPFFWLVILSVAASAKTSVARSDFCGRMRPSFQKPISCTRNWTVLVAWTIFPLRLTLRGFVYSPLRRR